MTAPPSPPTTLARRLRHAVVAVVVLTLAVTACGGPDELEGTIVSTGTSGRDDQPLGAGWLAVLDDGGLRDFLGAAGIDPPPEAELSYLAGRVRREDVTRAGGSLVTIDDKGEFTLTTTGPRTICLLVEAPQVDLLSGCVALDLPATGKLALRVGQGELEASLQG